MKIVIISDIHIHGSDDPLYRSLLTMAEQELKPGDALVLAGDIFDFFVGKQPVLLARYGAFFSLLRRKLDAGVKIEYIEGNHDFHLRRALASVLESSEGLQVHPSEVSLVTPQGRKIYVAHGDLVDREDRGYLALRTFFRSPFIHLASIMLPGSIVEKIGESSSAASQKANPRSPLSIDKKRLGRLREKFRAFAESKFKSGYDAIVMGHCHDLDSADFADGSRRGRYLNVGFPRVHRSYVVFDDKDGLRRVSLP